MEMEERLAEIEQEFEEVKTQMERHKEMAKTCMERLQQLKGKKEALEEIFEDNGDPSEGDE